MKVYKYKLIIDKGGTFSLPNYYSIYLPTYTKLEGYITKTSLREFLLLLSLLMNNNQYINIEFVESELYIEENNILTLYEAIDGREYHIETFIKDKLGFYSGEMLIEDWVTYLTLILTEFNQSFVT